MKNILPLVFLIPIILNAQQAQDKMKAFKIGQEGISLMDKGEYDQAILKLEEGASYDTSNYFYPYHIAYVYIRKKDTDKAAETIAEVIKKHEDAPDQCYQMLGNLYDEQGNTEKALEVYETGLKKHPSSGRLYMEKGIVLAYRENETEEALECWETGIREEPDYVSNYYWASKLYCNSKNKIWGILYGEIFLHLEHKTERAYEISNFIYEAYEEGINIESKEVTVNLIEEKDNTPFSILLESELRKAGTIALKKKKHVELEGISKLRQFFLQSWFEKGYDIKYPNIILEYEKKAADAGFIDAYNYWLLKEGNKEAFMEWMQENESQYKSFLVWLDNNPLKTNARNKFYRKQYSEVVSHK